MSIYLYLKTHNKTGLKYLGKTEQDPYKYKGSGVVWRDHLKKHGYDVTTEILYETDNLDDFINVALDYSNKWNIVESKEFANLVPEAGEGRTGPLGPLTEEHKEKISKTLKKLLTDVDRTGENNPFYGKCHTAEHKQKVSKWMLGDNNPARIERQCPHCGKVGNGGVMKRWHFDNCKLNNINKEHTT